MAVLAKLIPELTLEDVREAVLVGACNIYHAASHNFLHAGDPQVLQALYKTAFFVLQAKYYRENGTYINQSSLLAKHLTGMDLQVLQAREKLKNAENFSIYSKLLVQWSSSLIKD